MHRLGGQMEKYWDLNSDTPLLVKERGDKCPIISYNPLWNTMKSKNISQYALLKQGIDNKTLDRIKKGKNITILTLEKLCQILDCTPNDVIEFIDSSSTE